MTEAQGRKIIELLNKIESHLSWAVIWLFVLMMTECGKK